MQVCDDRADRGGAELAQLLHLIPPDKLMIETDGPYLVPRTIKPAKARPRRYTTNVLLLSCEAHVLRHAFAVGGLLIELCMATSPQRASMQIQT